MRAEGRQTGTHKFSFRADSAAVSARQRVAEGGGRFPGSRCSPRCRLPELGGAQALRFASLRSAAAARPRRRRPGAAGGGRGAARTAPRPEPAALRDEEIRAQPHPEVQKLLCKDGSVPRSVKPPRPLYCLPLLHIFT